MHRSDYTQQNRRMWNETAALHDRGYVARLREALKDPAWIGLDEVERQLLESLDLAGRDVAQLCCNNARELVYLQRLGAARCVGFDISDSFIAQGRQLAAAAGADIELIHTDVYDIDNGYDGSFDLVYISVGAIYWLPAVNEFLAVARRLVKPGGRLFVYEMHPVSNMFDPLRNMQMSLDYFAPEPSFEDNVPDYMDENHSVAEGSWWFSHTLGDILSGVIDNGFALEHFREYPHDISMTFAELERHPARPPLSFTLIARRTE